MYARVNLPAASCYLKLLRSLKNWLHYVWAALKLYEKKKDLVVLDP